MGDENIQPNSDLPISENQPVQPSQEASTSEIQPAIGTCGDKASQEEPDSTEQQSKQSDLNSEAQQQSKQTNEAAPANPNQSKIEVFFRNTGNAPIMKKAKWAVSASFTVADTIRFIRKYLEIDQSLSIFLYVNQSFAPSLDQTIQNLYDCYASDKKLILYYATTQAWG